jgi:hypothetical protein
MSKTESTITRVTEPSKDRFWVVVVAFMAVALTVFSIVVLGVRHHAQLTSFFCGHGAGRCCWDRDHLHRSPASPYQGRTFAVHDGHGLQILHDDLVHYGGARGSSKEDVAGPTPYH